MWDRSENQIDYGFVTQMESAELKIQMSAARNRPKPPNIFRRYQYLCPRSLTGLSH